MESVKGEDKKFRAESDLRTLIEYEKICKDKSRFKAAMAAKKEKMSELASAGKHEEKE